MTIREPGYVYFKMKTKLQHILNPMIRCLGKKEEETGFLDDLLFLKTRYGSNY